MNKFAILQSGFISDLSKGLVHNEFIKDPFVDLALDKDHLKSKSHYFYFKEVDDLYEEWSKNNTLIKTMEFREKIIKAAKNAFNNVSIYNWLNTQKYANTVTSTHENFISETIGFVLGSPRSIQTSQWIRLLEVSEKAQSINLDIDKYFNRNNIQNQLKFSSSLLTDFIVRWVSQPNGFEDMLLSLYVIFGDRPAVTDVADKNIS